MFDHVMLSVKNFEESRNFYSAALKPLGVKIIKEVPEAKAGGFGTCFPAFWIAEGECKGPTHVAFQAPTRAKVRQFYEAALKAGAKDNGAPGFRPQYHKLYYGAFVLDPNGHNIEAVYHWPEGIAEWLGFLWQMLSGAVGSLVGGKAKAA